MARDALAGGWIGRLGACCAVVAAALGVGVIGDEARGQARLVFEGESEPARVARPAAEPAEEAGRDGGGGLMSATPGPPRVMPEGVPDSDDAVTIEEVRDAMMRLRAYLLSQRDAAGTWEEATRYGRFYPGGVTALTVYALLESGMPYQTDEVSRAIAYLRTPAAMTVDQTYTRSLRAHVWAALPNDFASELSTEARWLASATRGGLFDYRPRRDFDARYDHSVTQYGLLGLWESSKRRVGTPAEPWRLAAEHFMDVQNADGGWAYKGGGKSTSTMTAAGVTALLIAERRLTSVQDRPTPRLRAAIDKGLRWLDLYERMAEDRSGRTWRYYYLLSLERVALASGRQRFGGRDWLAAGTREILADLHESDPGQFGPGVVDAAFALAFLSRGTQPVWISKIELPAGDWNRRPNDMNRLTDELSDWRERRLGWQVVRTRDSAATWLNAPLAYMATGDAEVLNDAALEEVRRYIELGGQLIVSPDAANAQVIERVHELGARWFPWASWEQDGDGEVLALRYDGRTLMWLCTADWSLRWQRMGRQDGDAAWAFATRRFVESHGGGVVTHRLDSPWAGLLDASRAQGHDPRATPVWRARVSGQPWVEPGAWERLSAMAKAVDVPGASPRDVELAEVEPSMGGLLHVAGAEAAAWSEVELAAIDRFANAGGLVLIETIGGKGDFAGSWQRAWADSGRRRVEVWRGAQPDHALRRAGYGNRWWSADRGEHDDPIDAALLGANWRSSTTLSEAAERRPALLSVEYGGRVGIVVSHTDLTLGGMGVRSDEVVGLTPGSATRVLAALVHEASGRTIEIAVPGDEPGMTLEFELTQRDGIDSAGGMDASAGEPSATDDEPAVVPVRSIVEVETSPGISAVR
ncbi:MAG: hypothetical protein AAF823_01860 [Planctomycetota bacterium]